MYSTLIDKQVFMVKMTTGRIRVLILLEIPLGQERKTVIGDTETNTNLFTA